MQFTTRTLLTLFPLAVLPMAQPARVEVDLPAPAIAPRAPLDGYIVTQRLTTDGPNATTMTMRIKVAQGRIRFDIDSPELAPMGGMYMLVGESDKVITVLSQMGMAVSTDASSLSNLQGISGMPTMSTLSDITFTVDDLGAGEKMIGYATRKYRYNLKYSVVTRGKPPVKAVSTMDVSIATEVPGLDDGLRRFNEMFGSAFSGMAGGGSKALADEMKAKMPKGYALKVLVKSTETDPAGQAVNTTSTIEVTEFAKATIEATDFDVPSGMPVMDVSQMLRGGRGGR